VKQFFVLFLLFATPIVAQITDPFPAIQEGAFYEYKYTPLGGSNNTTLSICVLRYTNFRIEIYNVTKSSNVIKFTYNLTQEEYADGELVSTGWAVFDVNVPVNTSDINGWWINVNKGREAFEELVYGFAGALLADKIIINETTYNFNGQKREAYYGYFENTTTHSYGYFVVDKQYGFLFERVIVINETGSLSASQFGLFGSLVLKATNLFFLLYRPIIVISIIIIAVIVAVIIIRRKTGKIW